jgi:hypothetical protein
MRHHPAFFLGVSSTAFVMLCFVFALEFSAGALPSNAGSSIAPRSTDIVNRDVVNRTLKGDSLRTIVRPVDAQPFGAKLPGPATPPADGCESAFGPIGPAKVPTMAQRCVT